MKNKSDFIEALLDVDLSDGLMEFIGREVAQSIGRQMSKAESKTIEELVDALEKAYKSAIQELP